MGLVSASLARVTWLISKELDGRTVSIEVVCIHQDDVALTMSKPCSSSPHMLVQRTYCMRDAVLPAFSVVCGVFETPLLHMCDYTSLIRVDEQVSKNK